ncbi:hypothetical protein GCM10010968_03850 [Agrococcus terreus]|uniref:Uncharacterized protein n=1 Tax=Agrococcus terreus TaxID=574649 RepID=A0ABQ2KB65_9MICO|nr:hypothetical protein GCM10010968_03850 [Agrococcus terreus]
MAGLVLLDADDVDASRGELPEGARADRPEADDGHLRIVGALAAGHALDATRGPGARPHASVIERHRVPSAAASARDCATSQVPRAPWECIRGSGVALIVRI